jgi:hypothetical protein
MKKKRVVSRSRMPLKAVPCTASIAAAVPAPKR